MVSFAVAISCAVLVSCSLNEWHTPGLGSPVVDVPSMQRTLHAEAAVWVVHLACFLLDSIRVNLACRILNLNSISLAYSVLAFPKKSKQVETYQIELRTKHRYPQKVLRPEELERSSPSKESLGFLSGCRPWWVLREPEPLWQRAVPQRPGRIPLRVRHGLCAQCWREGLWR